MTSRTLLFSLLVGLSLALPAQAQGFKFSDEDASDKAEEMEKNAKINSLLSTPCRAKIKNQKIMVLIGESRNGLINARQSSYNSHVNAINSRLKAMGLKTYTQEQIRQQVAQAEIDAYFRNDPDAALNASKKLAANYILRGVIETQATRNLMVNVNQVNINMAFTLTGANGKLISQTTASNASYAGADTSGMALTLINESADEVVATLYSDYCRRAGTP